MKKVPHLSDQQQVQIGDGNLSLDTLTRQYLHDHVEYRYATAESAKQAFALEREEQEGALRFGKPSSTRSERWGWDK
ncbi:hypothetical protein GS504_16690 [Rhodococcus hoagii]|uniref:hypothetical protein n=1 Tax=Rhodococcus hoagii TaxID=43767 RepID=UPI000A104ABC|nr:hypothetical protein [Prescottella equi]NKR32085.1 hypothetical protein [Prescottella equi]NKS59091.1 hypothetical protein [Prescottella equi]ORM02287.1 hypothetical protein A5N69_01575 [Prescottella equi]ORM20019.1 hypothetical protein A5N74_08590 [Prescottella equi]QDP11261.1 hypothetical protein FNU77_16870 [Prescottella equi]